MLGKKDFRALIKWRQCMRDHLEREEKAAKAALAAANGEDGEDGGEDEDEEEDEPTEKDLETAADEAALAEAR